MSAHNVFAYVNFIFRLNEIILYTDVSQLNHFLYHIDELLDKVKISA